jgi:tetratricopeptide (TPR) repeat protein
MPDWEYRLPELSAEISPSYRATIYDTGASVGAAMQAYPQSPSAVSALALLHYLAHDRLGEERCWERCLVLDPKNALAHSRLVALAQQNANYARIVDLMHQALTLEPENGTYRGMLGSALMYLNRPEEARVELEKALAAGKSDAEAFLLLGEVYNQLDRPERAKRYSVLAADLAPHRPDTLYAAARMCKKTGDTEAASAYLSQFEQLKAAG